MSITLRRKMFKLGGETNTHGIGITSGLEYRRPGYNAGGQVAPIGQVGKGPLQMEGPDGKMREMQNPLALLRFLVPGVGSTAGALGASTRGLSGLKRFFMPTRTGRAPRSVAAREAAFKGIGPGKAIPGFERSGKVLTGMDRARQIGKIAGAAGGIGALGGIGSALLPQFEDSPEDTALEDFTDMIRGGSEKVADFMTFLPTAAVQTPFRKTEDIQGLTGLLKGEKAEKTVGSANDTAGGLNQKDISPAMETAQTQEEQFAKMKADADQRAEMYYAMLGGDGPNKVRALADAFTTAGALYDEDKSQALAGFSQGIQGELDRDEAVRDEARRLGLQEVVGLRDEERMDTKSRAQMVEQAKLAIMTSADMTPEQRQSTLRGLEAFELGVVDLLPTNDKGDEIDTGGMSPGSIYLDVNGITDGKYVAVSNDSNDPNQVDSFNNISEAEAHARS